MTKPESNESFEQIAERLAAKSRERGDVERRPVLKKEAEIIQFPLWPDPERGAPNAFLRSALFGVIGKGERRYCEQEKLAAWPDTELAFTGQQLDQYDLDVWMELVHLHRLQGAEPGKPLYVNAKARGFMREFGRGHGSNAAKAFYRSVSRMEACGVHMTFRIGGKEIEYISSLVQKAARVKGEERWAIVLNPDLLPFFAPGNFSRIELSARRALKSHLARWVQVYVCSHQSTPRQPHRIGVERLRELSGSKTSLKDFRWKLKKAMAELDAAGVVFSWRLTAHDALEFVRSPRGPKTLPEKT
jgi:hypothetical protein